MAKRQKRSRAKKNRHSQKKRLKQTRHNKRKSRKISKKRIKRVQRGGDEIADFIKMIGRSGGEEGKKAINKAAEFEAKFNKGGYFKVEDITMKLSPTDFAKLGISDEFVQQILSDPNYVRELAAGLSGRHKEMISAGDQLEKLLSGRPPSDARRSASDITSDSASDSGDSDDSNDKLWEVGRQLHEAERRAHEENLTLSVTRRRRRRPRRRRRRRRKKGSTTKCNGLSKTDCGSEKQCYWNSRRDFCAHGRLEKGRAPWRGGGIK